MVLRNALGSSLELTLATKNILSFTLGMRLRLPEEFNEIRSGNNIP